MIVMITNSRVPYCYDIPHVVGLPCDYSHRFRYTERWIKLSPAAIKNIKGQAGLIVLRDFDTGNFIPVRYVQIERVHSFGNIHYIEFLLKDYFSSRKEEVVTASIEKALQDNGCVNKGGTELKCLVLEMDGYDIRDSVKGYEENGELKKWANILCKLGKLKCYKEYSFLKILRVQNSKEENATITKAETGKYLFTLESNCLYYLDVVQHVPWKLEETESITAPYEVELKAETDELTVLRRVQRVVGKYDLLRFIFKTPLEHKTKHTFLELENKQSNEIARHGLSALFIPVQILPPKWLKIARVLRGLLIFLAFIAIVLAGPIATYFKIGADWVRGPAMIILVFASGRWEESVGELVKGAKDIRLPFFKS